MEKIEKNQIKQKDKSAYLVHSVKQDAYAN